MRGEHFDSDMPAPAGELNRLAAGKFSGTYTALLYMLHRRFSVSYKMFREMVSQLTTVWVATTTPV